MSIKDKDKYNFQRREYHNNKIYWNLEFFGKMTLALCGGIAYLVFNYYSKAADGEQCWPTGGSNLFSLAAGIQLFLGLVCVLNIRSHCRAKLRYALPTTKCWEDSDTYICVFILFVTAAVLIFLWPLIGTET